MSLTLRNIEKAYAAFPALNGVSLEARPGEFLALLGPSGSGKTTLLRVIAGLEKPEVGEVDFDGEDFLALTARERRIGFVFQNYALFRHMSVAQNIAFGLSVRPRSNRPSKAEQAATVERLLALVQLEGLGKRYPDQLSGGQRQRVALARALAIEPRMLLLDEPFGALDAVVRRDLRRWLRKIHDESGVTTIFVTHDQQEAMDVADRVAVLNRGRIEQIGAPRALYDAPASAFVMTFLGEATCVRGEVKGGRAIAPGINLPVANPSPDLKTANLYFRPHDVKLSDFGPGIAATLVSARLSSGMVRLELTLPDGGLLEADTPRDRIDSGALTPGATIHVEPTRVYAFADEA